MARPGRRQRLLVLLCIVASLLLAQWLGAPQPAPSPALLERDFPRLNISGITRAELYRRAVSGPSEEVGAYSPVFHYQGPISDALWNTFVNRGRDINALLGVGEECLTGSSLSNRFLTQWQSPEDLEEYGWSVVVEDSIPEHNENSVYDSLYPMLNALQGLQIPLASPPFSRASANHIWESDKLYKDRDGDMVPYQPTGADYVAYFNPVAGLIVIDSAFGPKYCAVNRVPGFTGEVVPLQYMSDIVYLLWREAVPSHQRRNIQYIMIHNMINSGTDAAVFKALSDRGQHEIPTWPGVELKIGAGGDGAMALLGCTNIHGIGRMLYQHKRTLGHKIIDSIVIWEEDLGADYRRDPRHWSPNALIKIKTVANVGAPDDVVQEDDPDDPMEVDDPEAG